MIWIMILEIAITGQMIALEVGSEEECRVALARIAAGERMTITMKDGLKVPVAKGIDCQMKKLAGV